MTIKNKLVCDVGVNDASYIVQPVVNGKQIVCQIYRQWHNMINRCYNAIKLNKDQRYIEVTVCHEWLTFSNFKKWMELQDWEGNQLDKDIVIEGSKIYSPETCAFIDKATNTLFGYHEKGRGDYPLGVCSTRGEEIFRARCSNGNDCTINLGHYTSQLDAHHEYLKYKIKVIEKVAAKQSDERVINGLLGRIPRIRKAILDGVEYKPEDYSNH